MFHSWTMCCVINSLNLIIYLCSGIIILVVNLIWKIMMYVEHYFHFL